MISQETLTDYIRRAMPITNPQSLSNDEVYAVTAYILSLDNVVPRDATLAEAAERMAKRISKSR